LSEKEHDIQAGLVRWATWNIKKYPALDLLMAFCNERKGGYKEISYFMAEGLKPGAPDLFLSVARHGYHGLYLETKTLTGQLSAHQRRIKRLLIAEDYKFVVYRTVPHGIKLLKDYLSIREE